MSPRTQKRQETAAVPRPRGPAKEETASAAEAAEAAAEEIHEEERERRGVTIPVVHTTVRPPAIGLPKVGVPSLPLPSMSSTRGRVLWLGGLGAFAAFGVIDWPVAVAVAAGTWVAEQRARERLQEEQEAAAHHDQEAAHHD